MKSLELGVNRHKVRIAATPGTTVPQVLCLDTEKAGSGGLGRMGRWFPGDRLPRPLPYCAVVRANPGAARDWTTVDNSDLKVPAKWRGRVGPRVIVQVAVLSLNGPKVDPKPPWKCRCLPATPRRCGPGYAGEPCGSAGRRREPSSKALDLKVRQQTAGRHAGGPVVYDRKLSALRRGQARLFPLSRSRSIGAERNAPGKARAMCRARR
jgi:hypothetical protein